MKIFFTFLFFILTSLHAQELQTIVKELLSSNPLILERLYNYKTTHKNIEQVQSGYYPKVDISLASGKENIEKKDILSTKTEFSVYEASLKYTQNIFNGFETNYQVKEEQYRTFSAAYSYIEKTNSTVLDMTNSYLQILKNNELLLNAQENIDINQDIADKVHKLYDAGLTTLSEVNKIESSLALAKANIVVQENTILNEAYQFKRLLGRNITPSTMILPSFQTVLPKTVKEAQIIALNTNPTLLVSRFNIKLLQASNKKAKAKFYPKVDIEISQTLSKNLSAIKGENNRFRAMAYISYNMFNGFSDSVSLQKSLFSIEQELQKKSTLKRSITENVNIAYSAKIKLAQQLVYLKSYRDYSLQTLDLYSKEYDLGRRSLLDLLSAQNDFIKAKAQIISTKYDVLYAKYRILNAMGILVSSLLKDENFTYSNVNITYNKKGK